MKQNFNFKCLNKIRKVHSQYKQQQFYILHVNSKLYLSAKSFIIISKCLYLITKQCLKYSINVSYQKKSVQNKLALNFTNFQILLFI